MTLRMMMNGMENERSCATMARYTRITATEMPIPNDRAIIPLQAMLQDMSPDDERGRFLGTANAISFGFLSLASAIYWIIRPMFFGRPEAIFLVSAGLMICGAGFFVLKLRRSGPILGG